jgi:uncharacterized protein
VLCKNREISTIESEGADDGRSISINFQKGVSIKMNAKLSAIKFALVTGASSGIGLQYCNVLAKAGVNLVLVARNEQRLQAVKQDLIDKYAIKVLVVQQDLSVPGAAQAIFNATERESISIDMLINNAGHADQADFLLANHAVHLQMINAMLTAVVSLCHFYLPKMLENKTGNIINVGSVAGIVGYSKDQKGKRSHRTMYRPIKSFVISFTEQLAQSYKGTGIRFQCICPGLTVSDFHQRSGEVELYSSLPKFMWMSSAAVVDQSLRSLFRSKKVVVVTGWFNKIVVLVWRIMHLV